MHTREERWYSRARECGAVPLLAQDLLRRRKGGLRKLIRGEQIFGHRFAVGIGGVLLAPRPSGRSVLAICSSRRLGYVGHPRSASQ
jgi:hypothetical protein